MVGRAARRDGGRHLATAQLPRVSGPGHQGETPLASGRAEGGMSLMPLVEARGVHKSYWLGEKEIHVLRGASFSLEAGQMASLVGPSGVGKSTFLHVIGTLDPPTAGTVLFDGQDAYSMTEEELAGFRNPSIGFGFQFHYLLPEV